jgi:hypothetical protein
MFENCNSKWSKGRLFSHLFKLVVLRTIDPEDGSIELEMQDCMEILSRRYSYVLAK